MPRAELSLADAGLNLGFLDDKENEPVLSATVAKETLDEALLKVQTKCPEADFSPTSLKKRSMLLQRIDLQLLRLEAQKRKWLREKADCLALKPYDEAVRAIYAEYKVL